MKIVIIGSGSGGNATYIESGKTKIIIDAGLTLTTIKERLRKEHITLDRIDALFISHAHSDHIGHIDKLLAYTKATLYINSVTYEEAMKKNYYHLNLVDKVFFNPDTRYDIGSLSIVPITLSHDTLACFGFLIKEDGTNDTFGSITDTGIIHERYFNLLSKMKILLFESNHDVRMLVESDRPLYLVKRILSEHGHLSNEQCNNYLKHFVSPDNKMVILGHISKECNSYELAYEECMAAFNGNPPFELKVAYQDEQLPIIDSEQI